MRSARYNIALAERQEGIDMVPTNTLLTAMMTALGSDTTMLAGALWLFPIKSEFSPGPDPVLTDADLADFDGSGPKTTGAATRPVLSDPVSGDIFIRIPDPAGGWQWTTTGTTNLPQTIYGVALSSDSATIEGAELLGTALLPGGPVELNITGNSFGFSDVDFRLVLPALQ